MHHHTLSVATRTGALAVGLSLALLDLSIWLPSPADDTPRGAMQRHGDERNSDDDSECNSCPAVDWHETGEAGRGWTRSLSTSVQDVTPSPGRKQRITSSAGVVSLGMAPRAAPSASPAPPPPPSPARPKPARCPQSSADSQAGLAERTAPVGRIHPRRHAPPRRLVERERLEATL